MIYLGNNELAGVMLGSNEIAGIYVGDDLIYPMTVTAWSVSPSAMTFASTGGTSQVRIAALSSWTISSSESWITFSQASGDSGRTSVTVTAAALSGSTPRTATITVTDGTNTSTVSVTQNTCNPVVISAETNYLYVVPAGTVNFTPCEFDTTGVYSIINDDTRTEPIMLCFTAASSTLRTFDATLDLSNATDDSLRFSQGFYGCTALESVNLSGVADYKVISCYGMFQGCTALTSVTMNSFVGGYEAGNLTSYDYMFYDCTNLLTIDAIDLTRWSNITNMFTNCTSLENLTITNLKDDNYTTWGLENCTALTVTSLVSILNALPTTSEPGNRRITIGQTNINKLTQAQLDIALNKGWNVN